tara:strand:- start:297 stop:518 length:222 start_codon:yes stop_codon:yes gene_type:complete
MKKLIFQVIDENGNRIPGHETELQDLVINDRHLIENGEWNEEVANQAIEDTQRYIAEQQAEAEFEDRGGMLDG